VSAAYLGGYLRRAAGAPFIPVVPADLAEKLVYEIGYEMNNRPAWLSILLSGVLRQVEA
jgi:predicted trehalose synthase